MYYVGLDVHQSRSSLDILDGNARPFKHLEIRGSSAKVVEQLRQFGEPFQITYEASCGYGHLHDQLAPLAQRVVVAHPGHLRLIFRAKRKNDRVDSRKLAKLLALDLVPQVHVPKLQVRTWRSLINFRRRLVARRTGIKSQIKALLRELGITAPPTLWSKNGLAWLQELAMPDGCCCVRRDMLMDEMKECHRRVKQIEKELNSIALKHPGARLLMTIPGVGIRTAEAVIAYIDDVRRFGSLRQVSAYFGLVPCQDQSSDTNHLGHITKEGPAVVRWLVAEAAWQAARRSPTVKAYFQRIMKGDPDRRKIALVATMHYLVRVMTAMLRSGELWRESAGVAGPSAPGASPQTPPPLQDGLRPAVRVPPPAAKPRRTASLRRRRQSTGDLHIG